MWKVAGVDAHATYWVVCVLDRFGEVVQEAVRISTRRPQQLLELLEKWKPLEVVVETCPMWPWLFELVQGREGMGFVLAHATRLRAIAESNYKRDEVDCELLGRMQLAGLIPQAYPKRLEQRERALLVRHRARLVRERTMAVNRVHAQLQTVGLRLERGRLLTRKGQQWVREHAAPLWGEEQRRVARTHFALIRGLSGMIRALDRRIRQAASESAAARLLQSIPGVGPYRSLLIAAEVLPVSRFPSPEHLVSYSGLAPRSRQSGLRGLRHGSIPAGANRWLRGAFVRTIVSHCRHAPESWITREYTRQKGRLGWEVARIAAARKMARVVHAMLRTGEVWHDTPAGSVQRGELHREHVAGTT